MGPVKRFKQRPASPVTPSGLLLSDKWCELWKAAREAHSKLAAMPGHMQRVLQTSAARLA